MRAHPAANSDPVPGKKRGNLRPFPPGRSGNPTGRPRTGRTVSKALAGILDTTGSTTAEVIATFKKQRGRWLCGADHAAVGLYRKAVDASSAGQVAAAMCVLDRTEGKIEPSPPVAGGGNFTMNITIQALGGESLEGLPACINVKAIPEPLPALPAAVDE